MAVSFVKLCAMKILSRQILVYLYVKCSNCHIYKNYSFAFAFNLLLLLNTILDLFTIGFLRDRDDLARGTIDWDGFALVLRPHGAWGGHILKNDQAGAGLVSEGRMGVDVCKHLHKNKPNTFSTHNRYRKGACAHRTTPWGRSLA